MGPGMIFKPSTSPRSPQQPSPAETLDLGFFSGVSGAFPCAVGGMWDGAGGNEGVMFCACRGQQGGRSIMLRSVGRVPSRQSVRSTKNS